MLTATGTVLTLAPMAQEICRRYLKEFPDEADRYGAAAEQWCLHDNSYLLAWAIQDARDGTVHLIEQALWLQDVLASRGFPDGRLASNLEIAASVAAEAIPVESLAGETADRLVAAADALRTP